MDECFMNNNLISPNQSGFEAVVSCVNQLLSIGHVYEVRTVFLDIFKAFNKLWHLGLYKLKQNGMADNLLKLLTLVKQEKTKSGPEWSVFSMSYYDGYGSSRLSSRTLIISDVY